HITFHFSMHPPSLTYPLSLHDALPIFKPDIIEPINHKQLDSLFAKDNFFNDKFLVRELDITLEYKPLFFEYLEAQNIHDIYLNEDRKSTRLNSSHVKTSYAVFCLTTTQ